MKHTHHSRGEKRTALWRSHPWVDITIGDRNCHGGCSDAGTPALSVTRTMHCRSFAAETISNAFLRIKHFVTTGQAE
jgi:hypothetical protein